MPGEKPAVPTEGFVQPPLWVECSWLLGDWEKFGHILAGTRASPKPSKSKREGRPIMASSTVMPAMMAGITVGEVWSELEHRRAPMCQATKRTVINFKFGLRGAALTAAHRGVVADSYRCEACDSMSQQFFKSHLIEVQRRHRKEVGPAVGRQAPVWVRLVGLPGRHWRCPVRARGPEPVRRAGLGRRALCRRA